MNKKEKELFKSLCSFRANKFNENLLEYATPAVLGELFFNRMQAVAYGTLKKHDLLGKVNREFRNSLKGAYTQNCEKNVYFFLCVKYVEDILSKCDCAYAMLKGAYLCKLYPKGYRSSNDIDILVAPQNVDKIGNALIKNGFKQGNIRGEKFVEATRKEIVESKMTRGETVPYIKEVGLPGMQFIEVDINYSLDYKNSDTDTLERMLFNTVIEGEDEYKIHTLRKDDFFVHLCSHLYKEATTLPWVEMKRDMTMYKYCDIYMLLNNASIFDTDFLFKRSAELGLEKICAFAVIQMSRLFHFENDYALKKADAILEDDPDFIHYVISPKEKKKYLFSEKFIEKRFFAVDRVKLLKEDSSGETVKDEAE